MIKYFKDNSEKIITILVYVVIFISLIYPYRDKDWGWHFQYGKYFITTGKIMVNDIYSWTMSGFPWKNPEWLFDPIIYIIFKNFSYMGAALAGTIVSFFCFWLLAKLFKLDYWKLAIAGFFFVQITETGVQDGLRSQNLALIPLTILLYILIRARNNFKLLWTLPPLMFVWVNLHGSFIYGLMIIGIFFAVWFFTKPKIRRLLVGVGFLSITATLFNPFGLGVYGEDLIHAVSPYLKYIYEWLPITDNCPYCHVPTFAAYIIILAIAFIKSPNIENLPFLIITLILIYPTVIHRRNLPDFGIATFPLFAGYLQNLKLNLGKYKITPFVFLVLAVVAIEYNLFSRLPSFDFYKYNETDYCYYSSGCSLALTDFLIKNPPTGYGFNFYDWGGYLIGKEEPFKLFVDGRMHLWKNTDGYMAFADFIAMYYAGNYQKFDSYNFDWVMVQPTSDIAQAVLKHKVSGNWIIKYQDQNVIYLVNAKVY